MKILNLFRKKVVKKELAYKIPKVDFDSLKVFAGSTNFDNDIVFERLNFVLQCSKIDKKNKSMIKNWYFWMILTSFIMIIGAVIESFTGMFWVTYIGIASFVFVILCWIFLAIYKNL